MNNLTPQKDALGNDLSMFLTYSYSSGNKTVIGTIRNVCENRITLNVEFVYEFIGKEFVQTEHSGTAKVQSHKLYPIEIKYVKFLK